MGWSLISLDDGLYCVSRFFVSDRSVVFGTAYIHIHMAPSIMSAIWLVVEIRVYACLG